MASGVPSRPLSAVAWELRTYLALGTTVRLTLSERCDGVRLNPEGLRILEGKVTSVSPTDAYCMCAGRHVPVEEVLTVKRPHHTDGPASDPRDPD